MCPLAEQGSYRFDGGIGDSLVDGEEGQQALRMGIVFIAGRT
jgi:hypothetical protein